MSLDRTQPYGEVGGIPGVKFEQGGRFFNPGGVEVTYGEEDADGLRAITQLPSTVEDSEAFATGDDLDTMHWRHLKAMVESFGGTWTNKEDALAFLKG